MLTRVAALLALGLGGLFAVLPRADAHDAAACQLYQSTKEIARCNQQRLVARIQQRSKNNPKPMHRAAGDEDFIFRIEGTTVLFANHPGQALT